MKMVSGEDLEDLEQDPALLFLLQAVHEDGKLLLVRWLFQ